MAPSSTDYDPFARGPHPVGVRTAHVGYPDRDRNLPVEVWYPAEDRYTGQDVDPATQDRYETVGGVSATQEAVRDAASAPGEWWGIVHSHGMAGNRRVSTFLNTHLASQGYVVAAPDHLGNTTADVMQLFASPDPPDAAAYIHETIADRPPDSELVIDALLRGDLAAGVRPDGVGMSGHSYGGWTTLQVTGRDARVLAAVPLAPAGGCTTRDMGPAQAIIDALDLDWGRRVPTEMVVADLDSVLPLDGMVDILTRAESIERMVVIVDADHFHFNDGTDIIHDLMAPLMGRDAKPMADLVPGAAAHAVCKAMSVAHFDRVLRGSEIAADFLAGDLRPAFAEHGATVEIVPSPTD